MEWLHVRVVRGSQKALAKKDSIKSLQDHTEPLKEGLGLESIAGPLWNSVTKFLEKKSQRRSAGHETQMLAAETHECQLAVAAIMGPGVRTSPLFGSVGVHMYLDPPLLPPCSGYEQAVV